MSILHRNSQYPHFPTIAVNDVDNRANFLSFSPRAPLTNGHDVEVPADSLDAVATPPIPNTISANVGEAPPINGISKQPLELQKEEADVNVNPPSITDESHLPIPDPVAVKPTSPLLETAPAIVQPTVSDVREETQPADPVRAAEIIEQKQQEDLAQDPTPLNGSEVALEPSLAVAPEPNPIAETAPPPASAASPTPTTQPTETSDAMDTQTSVSEPPAEIKLAEVTDHPPVPIPDGAKPELPLDPAPTPIPQADGPPAIDTSSQDQVMDDAPASLAKVSREREDDDVVDEPSAKRAKTEEDTPTSTDFKKPEQPASIVETAPAQTAKIVEGPPMTKPQQKHLLKTIGNVKRIHAAKMFLTPVDYVALNLPNYPTIVTNPMDLKTLEDNVRADKYTTVNAVVASFNQIVENSRLFNGPEHLVTAQANDMRKSFDKAMEKLPGPEVTEGHVSDKKKKIIEPGPVKIPPPRRESRSSLPGTARSPASAGSPQTFALSPEGVPLIRRDSTVDGRPKREIHRPAPKDLPYSNQKPKKKKYQWELKFCEKVLGELSKPKYQAVNYPFMTPVDPVALNIPTYHNIVKKPMDFGTMKQKLDRGEYENARDFESDARLVFQNCYKFNPPGDVIHNTGKEFEKTFDLEWSKKKEWLENNTPSSGPQSPGSSPEPEESEEEEEEGEEEEDEDQSELTKLQQHIAALSKQVELIQKKKKSPPAPSKKSSKQKPAKKESKKSAPAAPAKAEKKVSSKPKKEKVPYVTYEQKQDISMRINSLTESKMATALKIIRDNMPNLKVCKRNAVLRREKANSVMQGVQDDELELDIDELSNDVLHKLLMFVRKHAPRPDDSPAPLARAPTASSSTAAPARKKNKPMSKHEQEARIAQVQNSLSAYNQGSPPAREFSWHFSFRVLRGAY